MQTAIMIKTLARASNISASYEDFRQAKFAAWISLPLVESCGFRAPI